MNKSTGVLITFGAGVIILIVFLLLGWIPTSLGINLGVVDVGLERPEAESHTVSVQEPVQVQPTQEVAPVSVSSSTSMTVRSDFDWQYTDVAVTAGDKLIIEYISGQWSINPEWGYSGPEGYGNFPLNPDYPIPDAQPAFLIGKINQTIFRVGYKLEMTVQESGRLYLRINDDKVTDNDGSFDVIISVAGK